MKQKEYPMDENYNKALEFLTAQIAERDEMRKQLKLLPPEARPEGLRLLSEMDKAIERGEQALANEYEAVQKQRRLEEERDEMLEEATRRIAGAYVHAKYRNPELIDEMDEIIAKMGADETASFYRIVDEIESGDLVRVIRREGETRKEAEEFLKNFRRQEEEERAALFQEFLEKFSGSYVHAKYRQPKIREEFDEIIAQLKPEQAKEFYDLVARLEAYDLISLIALEGETREQTEEFLENYRRQKEEERDAVFEDLAERMAMVFIHFKYRLPDKLDEMKATVLNDYTPEEEKEFYDRVAALEAGDLISIIAQQGETREQTEEFLKNFRAEHID